MGIKMLIKWIRCQVEPENKERFRIAQARWRALHGLPGFLGQAGGWNEQNPLEACIVSFWESEELYRNFMKHDHDAILEKTEQIHTYSQISVLLYKGSLSMENDPLPFPERLSSIVQRYLVMTVSHGVEEALSLREDALLLASGQSDRQPNEAIQVWLDLIPVRDLSLKSTSFYLEKTWLVN